MSISFHQNTLPPNTAQLIKMLQEKSPSFLTRFYLSGGTALSLQIGHRQSDDLDFFSQQSFQPEHFQGELETFGFLTNTELALGTLNCYLDGVKLQFLEYPYPLIKPTIDWNTVQLSSIEDIACTKLHTISSRGSKKDFIDIYYLLQRFTLVQLFSFLENKYLNVNYNQVHILKSLVYFADADGQPMPRMIEKLDWNQVKSALIKSVKQFNLTSISKN